MMSRLGADGTRRTRCVRSHGLSCLIVACALVSSMAGHFEVYKDAAGKYRFRLKAANGEVIATGEAYNSKEACMDGVQSVKNNAPTATVKEV
jgi:uncharacterized protein YegP (UPF0339 family)